MFLCGRKEEFSRTATSSKTGKTKNKQTKKIPKRNTILKLKLVLEYKHSSHRLGLSRTEVVQVQHTLKLGYTYPSLGNTERNLVSHS